MKNDPFVTAFTQALSGCYAKQGFPSKKVAEDIANKTRRRTKAAYLNTYRCAECGQWHIGTTSPKDKK